MSAALPDDDEDDDLPDSPDYGVEVPAEPDRYLSREDLFRVELSQTKLQLAGALTREKRLEDQYDDAAVSNQQLSLQVKAHELTIARLHRKKSYDASLKRLDDEFNAAGEGHEALKKELAQRYAIENWNSVAYDDVSGRLTLVPVPTKES